MQAGPRLVITGTAIALAALTLAGCSPASDGAKTAASAKPKASAGVESTGAADDADADAEAAAAAPGACLIGDWVLADDQMQAFYDQVNADLTEYGIVYDPTGTAGLSFADDGTYAYTPNLTLAVDIAGLPAAATMSGTLAGQYTADATTVTTDHDTNGLTMDVTVDGVAMDGTPVTEQILASPIASSAYDCSGDTPVVQFSTGPATVPLTLTRG
ncbi:hypothetical protein SAMN05428970_0588 [Agromyces sp. CF514]|uniref:hypothetical protein n=1 Tax=Agromyces sp. CF514 TaxID=1881031 RepID=UPI0008DF8F11|nr:hypothetical protein [Agromyces sp. CF514]SFR69046.1 hypothetical protein SAMN05428970_0588 [Agromyces sp. CF514]